MSKNIINIFMSCSLVEVTGNVIHDNGIILLDRQSFNEHRSDKYT